MLFITTLNTNIKKLWYICRNSSLVYGIYVCRTLWITVTVLRLVTSGLLFVSSTEDFSKLRTACSCSYFYGTSSAVAVMSYFWIFSCVYQWVHCILWSKKGHLLMTRWNNSTVWRQVPSVWNSSDAAEMMLADNGLIRTIHIRLYFASKKVHYLLHLLLLRNS
jgi:hypothetical protein